MSASQDVLDRIVANLQGINGGGSYTHDLSNEGQVLIGRYDVPPLRTRAPFVCVYRVSLIEFDDNVPFSQVGLRDTVMANGWVPANPHNVAERVNLGSSLQEDIRTALRADPDLGGLALRFTISGVPLGLDEVSEQGRSSRVFGATLNRLDIVRREARS